MYRGQSCFCLDRTNIEIRIAFDRMLQSAQEDGLYHRARWRYSVEDDGLSRTALRAML
ncbi:hypothetical protein HMPREF1988_02255 [Porphyromonas gingivalis F0185]|nr:hypothetical protein HMPREF1988_02255 [Porphyromonas gingivalis F0185]